MLNNKEENNLDKKDVESFRCKKSTLCSNFIFFRKKYLDYKLTLKQFNDLYSIEMESVSQDCYKNIVEKSSLIRFRDKKMIEMTVRHTKALMMGIKNSHNINNKTLIENNWKHLIIHITAEQWCRLCFHIIITCLHGNPTVKVLIIALNISSSYLMSLVIPNASENGLICSNLIDKTFSVVYTSLIYKLQTNKYNNIKPEEKRLLTESINNAEIAVQIFVEKFNIKEYNNIILTLIDSSVINILVFCKNLYTKSDLVHVRASYNVILQLCEKYENNEREFKELLYQIFVRTITLRKVEHPNGLAFDEEIDLPGVFDNLDEFLFYIIVLYKEKTIDALSKVIPVYVLSRTKTDLNLEFFMKLSVKLEILLYIVTDNTNCLDVFANFVTTCTEMEKIIFIKYLMLSMCSIHNYPPGIEIVGVPYRREIECLVYLFKLIGDHDENTRKTGIETFHSICEGAPAKIQAILNVHFSNIKILTPIPKKDLDEIMVQLSRLNDGAPHLLHGLIRGLRIGDGELVKQIFEILKYIITCRYDVDVSTQEMVNMFINSKSQCEKFSKSEVNYMVAGVVSNELQAQVADELLMFFILLHSDRNDSTVVRTFYKFIVENLKPLTPNMSLETHYAYKMIYLFSKSKCSSIFKLYMEKFVDENFVTHSSINAYESHLGSMNHLASLYLLTITAEKIQLENPSRIIFYMMRLMQNENTPFIEVEILTLYNIVSKYWVNINMEIQGALLRISMYKMFTTLVPAPLLPVYYDILRRTEPFFVIKSISKNNTVLLDIRPLTPEYIPARDDLLDPTNDSNNNVKNINNPPGSNNAPMKKKNSKKVKKQKKKKKRQQKKQPAVKKNTDSVNQNAIVIRITKEVFKNIIYKKLKPELMDMLNSKIYSLHTTSLLLLYSICVMEGTEAPHEDIINYLIQLLKYVNDNLDLFDGMDCEYAHENVSTAIHVLTRFTIFDHELFKRYSSFMESMYDEYKHAKVTHAILQSLLTIKENQLECCLNFKNKILTTLFSDNVITRQHSINYFEYFLLGDYIKLSDRLLHSIIILITDSDSIIQLTAMDIMNECLKEKYPKIMYTCFKESIFILNGNTIDYNEPFEVFKVKSIYSYKPPLRARRKLASYLYMLFLDNDRLQLLNYLATYPMLKQLLADRVIKPERMNTIKDMIFIYKIILDGTLKRLYRLLMNRGYDLEYTNDYMRCKMEEEKYEATVDKDVIDIYYENIDTSNLTNKETIELDDQKLEIIKNVRVIVTTFPSIYSILIQKAPACAFYGKRLAETIAIFYKKHITAVIENDKTLDYIRHFYDNIRINAPPRKAQFKCFNDYWKICEVVEYNSSDDEDENDYFDEVEQINIEDYETSSSENEKNGDDADSSFEERQRLDSNLCVLRLMKIIQQIDFQMKQYSHLDEIMKCFKCFTDDVGARRFYNH